MMIKRRINFNASFLLTIIFFSALFCSYDRGVIVTADGSEKKGYVRFDECIDRYSRESNTEVGYKESAVSPWESINVNNINKIEKNGNNYIFIDSTKITGENGPSIKVPADIILQGETSLYRYCTARYMSTMLSSKRMDLNIYLLLKKGDELFYIIPQGPQEFIIFSSEHFSSCPELVQEIKKTRFVKKIENPVPGNITEYDLVDEKDITAVVIKFNSCSEHK